MPQQALTPRGRRRDGTGAASWSARAWRALARAGLRAPLLALWLAFAGCARGASQADAPAPERTDLVVQNQAFLDMTVYVLRGSERVRLGQATGNTTTRLRIPARMLAGPTPLRFLADPIGSNRTPTSSEILVSPGEEVVLTIPPG
jgi:hypothetical protein